jgi:hypothetical protein
LGRRVGGAAQEGGLVAAPAGPAVEQAGGPADVAGGALLVAEGEQAAGDALVAVGQQERGPVELVVVVEHLPVDVQGGGRVALGLQEGRLQVPPAGPARARAAVVAGVGGDDRVQQRPRLGRRQAGPQRGRQAEEGVDHRLGAPAGAGRGRRAPAKEGADRVQAAPGGRHP